MNKHGRVQWLTAHLWGPLPWTRRGPSHQQWCNVWTIYLAPAATYYWVHLTIYITDLTVMNVVNYHCIDVFDDNIKYNKWYKLHNVNSDFDIAF